jgi:glycosyltransferase involved in cell wall biosynthesis
MRLCESLVAHGTDARVVALDWADRSPTSPYLSTFPLARGPRRLGLSPKMQRWLEEGAAAGRFDVVHNHSLWMMPNVYPGEVCRRHAGCRLVVSPRGTLSRWALGFHALRKRLFWHLLQRRAVDAAACFHATGEGEYQDIRNLGFTQAICILPNGIDAPPLNRAPAAEQRKLLFLGRVHPKKGVAILLRAWHAVEERFPEWELHVVGPDNGGHLADMQALGRALKLKRVNFPGPVYAEEKWSTYGAADLFVLPSHSENFGVAVAEALAAGTPAIVTVGAPWRRLIREGAGWSIDIGVDPLVATLEEALATSPERLREMGIAGRQWMIRDFSWQRIGAQWAATYRWLLHGGETPGWVALS